MSFRMTLNLCLLAVLGVVAFMTIVPRASPAPLVDLSDSPFAIQQKQGSKLGPLKTNPGPVPGIPGPNGLGHYGPFATIRRALEVVQIFQKMGYRNTIQFHNGDGQYVLPRR